MSGEQAAAPTFSVVVPVYDDTAGLGHCLAALAAQELPAHDFEVIVVDNGSRDPPRELVARYPWARLVEEPTPGSYAARNAGCARARGRFLAFTDADCRPRPDWLAQALAHFSAHPDTAAIGGAIALIPSRRPGAAELYDRTLSFRQDRFVILGGFAATANLVVRQEVFARIGPFDSTLKSTGDRDWGQRLTAAGLRLDYAAAVIVDHPPRTRLAALVAKRRRLEAGFRAVPARPRAGARVLIPTLRGRLDGRAMAATLLLRPGRLDLTRSQACRVLAVAGLMVLVGVLERLRLAAGGSPRR